MQDEAKDIRCGLILNVAVNKSVIYEYIHDAVSEYLEANDDDNIDNFQDFEFSKCGDNTYEDMFYEEFKNQYIDVLNTFRDTDGPMQDIICNLVNEYLNKKWMYIIYV